LKLISKLEICGSKISSATKFIDFFVHDILDYTLLNEKEQNFMPNNTLFNINTGVDEITEILEDKVNMKNIKIDIKTIGFQDEIIVKTDMKRM